MASFRELLEADQGRDPRGRHRRGRRAAATQPGAVVLDVREPDEYEQGAIPGALHIPRGTPREPTSRAGSPTRTRRSSSTAPAASARPSPPRRSSELGYTDVVSMAGGFNKWKDEGRDWAAPRDAHPRAAQPLPAPPAPARGRRGGPAEAARRQGPAARRRRPRLARRALPGRRRRRHASASSTWTSSTSRTCSARSSTTSTASASARSTRPRRRSPLLNPDVNVVTYDVRLGADNVVDILRGYDVIVDGADNFPTRYLVNDAVAEARHPGRARLDLPLRGPGHRVRAPRRPVLPLHDPRAAAGRAGAVVRRGRRARRAARHHRLDPGHRGDQAHPRPRRRAVGPAAGLRLARAVVPHLQGPPRPGVPGLLDRSRATSSSPSTTSSACPIRSAPEGRSPRVPRRGAGRP